MPDERSVKDPLVTSFRTLRRAKRVADTIRILNPQFQTLWAGTREVSPHQV